MRGVTAAIVGGAVLVLLAVAFFMRGGDVPAAAPEPNRAALGAPRPGSGVAGGPGGGDAPSARVEDRLGQLRAEYERRQIDLTGPGASKREVPTAAGRTRPMVERQERAIEEGDEEEDQEELAELRETLFNDPDPEERIGAVLMLTGEEGPTSMAMLVEAMGDPDAEVRLAVVEALGDRSEEISPGTLSGPLNDPDPEVRFEAVSILGDLEDPEAQGMVKGALKDPDEDVRALAEGILDFSDDDEPTHAQPATPNM
jgi:hypothetical protein